MIVQQEVPQQFVNSRPTSSRSTATGYNKSLLQNSSQEMGQSRERFPQIEQRGPPSNRLGSTSLIQSRPSSANVRVL
jgi:hypothetical protein